MPRWLAALTLLAACSDDPEPTSVELVVAGAVEAVARVDLRLAPSGGAEPAFEPGMAQHHRPLPAPGEEGSNARSDTDDLDGPAGDIGCGKGIRHKTTLSGQYLIMVAQPNIWASRRVGRDNNLYVLSISYKFFLRFHF